MVAYVAVQQTLSEQKIVVSDDADMFAGKQVNGPFTAYAQATVIGKHARTSGTARPTPSSRRTIPTATP